MRLSVVCMHGVWSGACMCGDVWDGVCWKHEKEEEEHLTFTAMLPTMDILKIKILICTGNT